MHRRIFYWATPLLAVLATLLLLELGLAWLHPVPLLAEHNLYYVPDPHTGYRLQAGSVGRFDGGHEGRVNSHGHRDDEIDSTKPAGTLRILTLGDSYTEGTNVAQHETYVQVLESGLASRLGKPCQVINAGVAGYHPFQYAEYYEHHGRAFDPDWVLVGFFVGNDSYSDVDGVDQVRTAVGGFKVRRETLAQNPGMLSLRIALYERSHLYRFFVNRNRFDVSREELAAAEPEARDGGHFPDLYLTMQRNRMRRNHRPLDARARKRAANAVAQIARLKAATDADGVELALLLIPDENQINASLARRVTEGEGLEGYDLAMPQKLLAPRFVSMGIHVIDPLAAFLADPRRLYLNDTHWSAAGHRLGAERVLAELLPQLR